MFGKCPKCDALISQVEVIDVSVTVSLQPQWKGFAYLCPQCRTVLNVEINPLLVRDEIVAEVELLLRKYLSR